MFVAGSINSSTTEDSFTMSYTVTDGFAPTYRSIFYNSTGNEISEVIGYPMRVNVTKQLTDSDEESKKKKKKKKKRLKKSQFSRMNFFKVDLKIIPIVVI